MIFFDLLLKLSTYYNDHSISHNLRTIFEMASEGNVVDDEDFVEWFEKAIESMNLEEGVDYRYRGESIHTVYVKGCVGMRLLMSADNELGNFACDYFRHRQQESKELPTQD